MVNGYEAKVRLGPGEANLWPAASWAGLPAPPPRCRGDAAWGKGARLEATDADGQSLLSTYCSCAQGTVPAFYLYVCMTMWQAHAHTHTRTHTPLNPNNAYSCYADVY